MTSRGRSCTIPRARSGRINGALWTSTAILRRASTFRIAVVRPSHEVCFSGFFFVRCVFFSSRPFMHLAWRFAALTGGRNELDTCLSRAAAFERARVLPAYEGHIHSTYTYMFMYMWKVFWGELGSGFGLGRRTNWVMYIVFGALSLDILREIALRYNVERGNTGF